jgi:hypothetical protein
MTWMRVIVIYFAGMLLGMLLGALLVHHYSQCFCPTFPGG